MSDAAKHAQRASEALKVAREAIQALPPSRAYSLALTKIEEGEHWLESDGNFRRLMSEARMGSIAIAISQHGIISRG